MKVFIKNKDDEQWREITKFIHGNVNIDLNEDGSGDQVAFTARFNDEFDYIDVSKAIKPKMQIKVTTALEVSLENNVNTFYFLTKDMNSVRLRKEVMNDDIVVMKAMYEHIVKGEDLLNSLASYHMPNYTITQPKTEYFSRYTKSMSKRYTLNQVFAQDGMTLSLDDVTSTVNDLTINNFNNDDGTIVMGYDSSESAYYIDVKDIDTKSFQISVGFTIMKTATSYFYRNFLTDIIKKNHTVNVYNGVFDSSTYDFRKVKKESVIKYNNIVKYYDEFSNEVSNNTSSSSMLYKGGEVEVTTGILNPAYILGFAFPIDSVRTVNIPINQNAKNARLYLKDFLPREEQQIFTSKDIMVIENKIVGISENVGDPLYNSRKQVIGNLESVTLNVTSSPYETAAEKKTTLLQFVNKAIHDYNYNMRYKVSLSSEAEFVLAVDAKEGEWTDFNFRELLERAFKYVGVRATLSIDNVISFSRPQKQAITLGLQDMQEQETEHIGIDYYDKVVSTAKNLVSEDSFTTERLTMGSLDTEFAQITTDNLGYLTSNDMYYVAEAKLYTPNFNDIILYGKLIPEQTSVIGERVKGNTGVDYVWDITSRLFESDIYNSFEDIRYDIEPETRSNPLNYSKGNTINYKSGSNVIDGVGHQAPALPALVFFNNVQNYAQHAIIEMLIVLAYEYLIEVNPLYANHTIDKEFGVDRLSQILNFELEITYAPIVKEITTKFVSNMPERIGLNYEKKVNANDRVVSYDDSEKILKNEMERKGNLKQLYSEDYINLEDTIPINSIVNGNVFVTNKYITLGRNSVSVDYALQENFLLQNEDIRLSVEFERYNVPYEYVNREMIIENHMIFSKQLNNTYENDGLGSTNELVERIMTASGSLDGMLYANNNLNTEEEQFRKTLMRVLKLESRFTMILGGKFLDNYSAGNYRNNSSYFNGTDISQAQFSQPFRYTDSKGKLIAVDDLEIGFTGTSATRLELDGGDTFPMVFFPNGTNASITTKLFESDTKPLLLKDAREAISLTHTTFLTTEDKDVKWYSFNSANRIGWLLEDVVLTDDLDFKSIQESLVFENKDFDLNVVSLSPNQYRVEIMMEGGFDEKYLKGLVLLYEQDDNFELVGVVKEPEFANDSYFEFYIMTTRYGKRAIKDFAYRQWADIEPKIIVKDTSVIVSYGSETFSDIIGVAISDYEIEYIEYIKLDLAVVINDMSIINTTNSKVFSDYIFVNSNLSVELYEYATITPSITIQDTSVIVSYGSKTFSDIIDLTISDFEIEYIEHLKANLNISITDTSVITNISSVILSDNIYVGASIDRTLVLPIEPIVSVSISIENTNDDDIVDIAITQSSATQLTYTYTVATSQGGTKNGSGIATNGLSNEYVRYNPYGDVQAYVYVTFPTQVVDGYYYKAKTIYAET